MVKIHTRVENVLTIYFSVGVTSRAVTFKPMLGILYYLLFEIRDIKECFLILFLFKLQDML